jgi:hypothetical protein
MRRIAFLALATLLLGPACYGPHYGGFPDPPAIAGMMGPGSKVANGGNTTPRPNPAVAPCREVSRIPCDVLACGGPAMDLVTLHCQGTKPVVRCVANGGCTMGDGDKPEEKPKEQKPKE